MNCTICLIEVDPNHAIYMGFRYTSTGADNQLLRQGHVVCQTCRDMFDILEDNPTHCRMCPNYQPAVAMCWDSYSQGNNFYCWSCLVESCESDQEIQKLKDIFDKE